MSSQPSQSACDIFEQIVQTRERAEKARQHKHRLDQQSIENAYLLVYLECQARLLARLHAEEMTR